jgi:hypothetical protein
MTERDRNPDILATADRLAEMTGGFEYRRDAIYDALASSSASGAGQRPKVKPLKWRPKRLSAREETDWYADSPVGQYAVGIVRGKPTAILRSLAGDDGVADKRLPGKPATIEDAKAAAQADYEARILSALDVPEPVTEVVRDA